MKHIVVTVIALVLAPLAGYEFPRIRSCPMAKFQSMEWIEK
jgi:hypothetical protein